MSKLEQKAAQAQALLKNRGPMSAPQIMAALEVSQPTLSRVLDSISDLLAIGGSRSRTYALARGQESYPIVQINTDAKVSALGELRAIHPKGVAFIPAPNTKHKIQIFSDIPFFIWDIRPQGYLGKIFVSQNTDLKLPDRWEDWQEADLYRTLKFRGDDLIGNLIIGHESFERFQQRTVNPISAKLRKKIYPQLAQQSLEGTHVGSSAGGEQPKFTAVVESSSGLDHVIVKFSPPTTTAAGKRWADLLYAEELALNLLGKTGYPSAKAQAIESNNLVFLEVHRFDRVGLRGRKGLLSLGAISDEYVGSRDSWTQAALKLAEQKQIKAKDLQSIIFLDCFGALIANTDRHFGNLSLHWEFGHASFSLAPIYDMLPMLYAPVQGNLISREFKSPVAQFNQLTEWPKAKELAMKFWDVVSNDDRISKAFQATARSNKRVVESSL